MNPEPTPVLRAVPLTPELILKQPALSHVSDWYASKGLVGEKKIAILQTLLAIKKQPFGIESLSGAGKSATMDLLANHRLHGDDCLLPVESVYIMGVSSKTAQMYNQKAINNAKTIYIEELQKAGNDLIITEMLKNLAEGKDFTREVTNMSQYNVIQQKIHKGIGLMYTLALENQHKNDEEMKRRFVVLTTDVSKEQTQKVVARKAAERFAKERLNHLTEEDETVLKNHVKACLNMTSLVYQNPFAEALSTFMPTPDQKVRSFVGHYFNVVDAVALYHYKDRVMKDTPDGKTSIYVTIQDVYLANHLYADYFTMDIHSIPPLGRQVLEAFNKLDYTNTVAAAQAKARTQLTDFYDSEGVVHEWATVTDIHNFLKNEMKVVLKHGITKNVCNELYEAGYLDRDTATQRGQPLYRIADKVDSLDRMIDWKKVWVDGLALMAHHRPEEYDSWLKTNRLGFSNPLGGERLEVLKTVVKPTPIPTKTLEVAGTEVVVEEEDIGGGYHKERWGDSDGINATITHE